MQPFPARRAESGLTALRHGEHSTPEKAVIRAPCGKNTAQRTLTGRKILR